MSDLIPEEPQEGWDGTLREDLLEDPFEDDDLRSARREGAGGTSWGLIVGSLVAVVAIAFMVFDGLQAETFFFDVGDAVERSDTLVGQTIRVRGTVVPGTFTNNQGSLNNQFDISEQGVTMTVVYNRPLPDTFQEESEVVTQGRFDEARVFHADEVLVKCPSRYEGAPPEAGESDISGAQASR